VVKKNYLNFGKRIPQSVSLKKKKYGKRITQFVSLKKKLGNGFHNPFP